MPTSSPTLSEVLSHGAVASSGEESPVSHVGDVRKEIPEEVQDELDIDQAAIEHLPEGTKVLSARRYGVGFFVNYCVETVLKNGESKRFFLKLAPGDNGKALLKGEYHSMTAIHAVVPSLAPIPLATGTFHRSPTSFYLATFLSLAPTPHTGPVLERFMQNLIVLHRSSLSPTGKFGFPLTTFHGKYPQPTTWTESWAECFTRILRHFIALDLEVNDPWPELESVSHRFLDNVIPKLLDPLSSSGRTIKPCVIHGDLWIGNTGTNIETGETMMFDAGALYAHHEMEMGMWRSSRHQPWGAEWKEEYLKQWGGWDEPKEMGEDRNRLYQVWSDMMHSCHWKNCRERTDAYDDMCYLVKKYDSDQDPGAHPELAKVRRKDRIEERDMKDLHASEARASESASKERGSNIFRFPTWRFWDEFRIGFNALTSPFKRQELSASRRRSEAVKR